MSFLSPLTNWPAEERRRITGVLTDIDDTLTTEGRITPDALAALHELHDAGLAVIPITGRPIGWSAPFAKVWPVASIVAENGSTAWVKNANGDGGMHKIYQQDEATRRANYERLQAVAARVLREVPGAKLAEDSPGRETDIAIDHSEFTTLPQPLIDQAVAIMREEGLNATVSSIHINGWIGDHDKWNGARWIVRELLGRDLASELDRWVYIGDSSNDQLMFERFTHSAGVANISRFLPVLEHKPRYLCAGERGAGFAELTRALLKAR